MTEQKQTISLAPKTIAVSVAILLAGAMIAVPSLMAVPFLLGGGLKIVYDLMLYRSFKKTKPPEEAA